MGLFLCCNVLLHFFRQKIRFALLASLKSTPVWFPLGVHLSTMLEDKIQQVCVLVDHKDISMTH